MTGNYVATKEDLKAIDKALNYVWHTKMNFVYKDKIRLKKASLISFDNRYLYLWTLFKMPKLEKIPNSFPKYNLYKVPHNLGKIPPRFQKGWYSGVRIPEFQKLIYLKTKKNINGPSGSLLTPFVNIHKKHHKLSLDPYYTYESYLATLVHEFGHIYWNSYKMWWPSDKIKNLLYLKIARSLYSHKDRKINTPLTIPTHYAIGELFAFCTEYYASTIFWPNHKKSLDKYINLRIGKLIKDESKKNLEQEDSVLEHTKNPHDFAYVFGKIILIKYPKTWPRILTNPQAFLF